MEDTYIFNIYAVLPSTVTDFSTGDNTLTLQYIADETAPSQVVLTSPTSGEVITTSSSNFIWNSTIDTGGIISGYVIQLSTGDSFDTVTTSGIVHNTGAYIPGLENNTYYRRVYAFDIAGNT